MLASLRKIHKQNIMHSISRLITSQYLLVLANYNYYTTTSFNGLFSRTTWVSRHQKGTPFCILLEQEMMGWQRHQLDHMQIICTSLTTDNYNLVTNAQ